MRPPSCRRRRPNGNEVNNVPRDPTDLCTIRQVCASNLDEKIDVITHLVQQNDYAALDTEFSGVLVRPADTRLKPSAYHYFLGRESGIRMELVQLGLSFIDQNGSERQIAARGNLTSV
ncbi:hypothetical protein HPB48_000257 [Haemaphysalis longicornis]|uniref:poly(A)-specific ribonuclease n=1 Tax=Haemaphysalis longicornis TaxID=44386 RepID=A0A9J6GQA3_HAELO|nr:hypothetical protein HPB48_000257 [Haemaphysalis longicornis]